MTWLEIVLWLLFWIALAVVYIYLARHYNIVDHPNHRSSHHHVTIRGGGIVFWIGLMVSTLMFNHFSIEFAAAVGLLGLASFIDDLVSIPALTRILIQFLSVLLLFWFNSYFHSLFELSWMVIPIVFIVIIGSMNIYNFMDGINGLSVCYTLLGLLSLMFFDPEKAPLYIFIALPLLAMSVFNVRPKGKASFFSGDIGSITAGFTLVYCILLVGIRESSIVYLSLIFIYLIDGGWTIIIRMLNKENIFEAHRSHVFQILANEFNWGHLKIVSIYISLQLMINFLLYFQLEVMSINEYAWFFTVFFALSMFYFVIRYYLNLALLNKHRQS
jgi:UDP-N-acetylmuramyl pentapeptide phosphotransferase/UDP-N-acetylglucosamine-1-phosphate transferase